MSDITELADAVLNELRHPSPLPAEPCRKRQAPTTLSPLLLSAEDVAGLLNLSLSTVWRMSSAGKLPRPLSLSRGLTRWLRSDVEAFIELAAERGCWPTRREFESSRDA